MAGVMLKQHSIDSSINQLNFVERENVTSSFVGGRAGFPSCFVKSPKGQNECTTDIPAIPGDNLAYVVACLQFLDSSLGG
jgi:hypothetical protein